MKRILILAACVSLLGVAPAAADGATGGPSVIGKRARRQIRHFLYPRNLRGDKRRVYRKLGYTPHRVRINAAGRVTEVWRYPERGVEFTFDAAGGLVATRRIDRESRREGIYH